MQIEKECQEYCNKVKLLSKVKLGNNLEMQNRLLKEQERYGAIAELLYNVSQKIRFRREIDKYADDTKGEK